MLLIDKVLCSEWYPALEQRFRCDKPQWIAWRDYVTPKLRSAPVFQISNVAEYLYLGTDKEVWNNFTDFPRPIPPFESCWMEFHVPRETFSEGERRRMPIRDVFDRIGLWITLTPSPVPGSAKYGLTLTPFCMGPENRYAWIMPVNVIGISDQYEPIPIGGKGGLFYMYPGSNDAALSPNRDYAATLGSSSNSLCFPGLLAMSLLNCRNVVTRKIQTPIALLKKHTKHGAEITREHHVIEIEPIIKVTRSETQSIGYSRRAASVIRGHFKDYRDGKGLFGKLRGLYWWHQQAHGLNPPEYRLKAKSGPLDSRWVEPC